MADRRRRVVLVTGASSGLGNACATQLAKRGYVVYGTGRAPDEKSRKADEFFELIRMESSDDDSVHTAVSYVLAKEDRIDALVCCAGMGLAGSVEDTPIFDAAKQLDVNFLGAARVVREALPGMRAAGGRILIVGSMAGRIGVPFQAYYAASKFALEGFVASLRMELNRFPVQVSIIEPGDFRTGFTAARESFGLSGDGPYAESGSRALAVMEESEMAGADPVLFARLVLKLLDKKRLGARYTVGLPPQRAALAIKRILPRRLYELMLMSYFKVLVRKGE
ncbi:MAG: short-chain dehydrogenase/reductase [Spirochaetae bacterium HGW-Spirochaetae-3]|jgi:NAD(P)-dependent dehydrogenase (short-subunit alcohol dehydrogenase family)|nr:MAG: short-chain dehydrogenase/reductase [Spirochaetae bacterium HGW-Spirochaetae-3]